MSINQFTEDRYEQTLIDLFKRMATSMNVATTWSETSATPSFLA